MKLKIVMLVLVGAGCGQRIEPLTVEQQVNREQVVQRLLARGVDGLRGGDTAGIVSAEEAFQLAAEIAPWDCRVLDGLGAVAWSKRQPARAKALFQAAIRADPRYSRPYAHLALVAEAEGDREAALALLRLALEKNPLNYRARAHEAVLLRSAE